MLLSPRPLISLAAKPILLFEKLFQIYSPDITAPSREILSNILLDEQMKPFDINKVLETRQKGRYSSRGAEIFDGKTASWDSTC